MFRLLVLCLPLLLRASSSDWLVHLDAGRFDTQLTADHQGNVIQARFATDCSLPVRDAISGCGPIYISKFDGTGRGLVFATYLGGPNPGGDAPGLFLKTVTTDRDGNIFLLLSTPTQPGLPLANPIQDSVKGNNGDYLCKLAADGSRVVYATYLSGSGNDLAQMVAVDARGSAWILTFVGSPDFPVTPGAPNSTAPARAAISRVSPEGTLEYSAAIDYGGIAPSIQFDSSGGALLDVNGVILRVNPDTGAIQQTVRIPDLSYYPVLASAANGFWVTGSVTNGLLPVTPDAAQSGSGASPVVRVAGGVMQTPVRPPVAHVVHQFAVDGASPGRVYAATDGGLFGSEDTGVNWTRLHPASALSITIDPFDPATLYLGLPETFPTAPRLLRSEDRGVTWELISTGLDGSSITSIAADPHRQGALYAAGRSLFRSTDGGGHWLAYSFPTVPGGTPSSNQTTTALVVSADPKVAGRVYTLTTTQCIGFCPVIPSVYRSDDAGATFTQVAAQLTSDSGPDFALDSNGDAYVLDSSALLVFRGGSFDQPRTVSPPPVRSFALDAARPGSIYVSGTNGSLLHSEDGGNTWTKIGQTPVAATRLAVADGGAVLAAQPADATDAFALRYDSSGTLTYGTYLGGGDTMLKAAAVGSGQHLYLAGATGPGLPVRFAEQSRFGGGKTDGFVAEFDDAGVLLAVTYLGGADDEEIDSVSPLDDGSVVVMGAVSDPSGVVVSRFAAELRVNGYGDRGAAHRPRVF